ncbi:hypothetical protein QMH00_000050 [Listeria monocytogenes]|nr:hypothetical protein [Listeria monocytogenes]
MTKIYSLYVEVGKYLESWDEESKKVKTTNDFSEAIKFTEFKEADRQANELSSDVAMVVEVTNLKQSIDC